MTRTILLTGATGTVSTALMDALKGADVNLRALVRDPSKAEALRERGVEVFAGDLDDPGRFRRPSRASRTSGCSSRTARAHRSTT